MSDNAQQFGPFEIVRKLGSGGMAETFVAQRHHAANVKQTVCLKRILPVFQDDPEFVQLFLQEARIVTSLLHDNIVKVSDFGLFDDGPYIALELVSGIDLRRLLKTVAFREEELPTDVVVYIAMELARALSYAHRQGVIHRDVSPANVLLGEHGEVKLTDFGIAKSTSSEYATRTGTVKGKIPYMAPEYVTSGKADPRSDIFSLGVVLFEVLTGARPFDGATDADTLGRTARGEHTRLSEVRANVPAALDDIIERMIAPDPAKRIQSADELIGLLAPIAPTLAAKLQTATLVEKYRDAEEPKRQTSSAPRIAFEPTEPATPNGTAIMFDKEEVAVAPKVEFALPHADTRTLAPHAQQTRILEQAIAREAQLSASRAPTVRVESEPPPRKRAANAATGVAAARKKLIWRYASAVFMFMALLAMVARFANQVRRSETPETRMAARRSERQQPAPLRRAVDPVARAAAPAETTQTAAQAAPTPAPNNTQVVAPSPAAAEPAAQAPREPAAAVASTTAQSTKRTPAPRTRGTVRVTVVPFGDVYVDGTRRGSAPLALQLAGGRHTIEGRTEERSFRKVVDVAPGSSQNVMLGSIR